MSAKRSKFHGLFPLEAEVPATVPSPLEQPLEDETVDAQPWLDDAGANTQAAATARNQENKSSRTQENKNSRNRTPAVPAPSDPVRLKTNYEIRQDYHRKLKNIANDEGRKMYQVIEEAIGRYLKAKGRL